MVIYDRNEKELVIPVGWGDDMEIDEKNRPYEEQYFTVEMQTDGLLSFSGTGVFSYSINGGEWEERSVSGARKSIIVSSGSTVRISSTSTRFGLSITSEDEHKVYGNVMSLLYGDDFKGKTEVGRNALYSLFLVNKGLTDASNLILPATTLARDCYTSMFLGCTNLTTAPELPATTLASGCYSNMFCGCTNLETAPELPATTLASYCYSSMFLRCTNLETAPELPATALTQACYRMMFHTCVNLTTAPELPATTLALGCYNEMFNDCTNLKAAPELPATELAERCYERMFGGCTNLETAPELPATTLAPYCYMSMFFGCRSLKKAPYLPAVSPEYEAYSEMFRTCTSLIEIRCALQSVNLATTVGWVAGIYTTGTFYRPEGVEWRRDASGIPEGWEIKNLE